MNKSNTTEKVITSIFTLIIGVLLLTWYVMVVIIGIVVTLIAAAIFED